MFNHMITVRTRHQAMSAQSGLTDHFSERYHPYAPVLSWDSLKKGQDGYGPYFDLPFATDYPLDRQTDEFIQQLSGLITYEINADEDGTEGEIPELVLYDPGTRLADETGYRIETQDQVRIFWPRAGEQP